MEDCSDHLKQTIKTGRRQQEPFDPRKYRYMKNFEDLVNDNNHIVAIAMFKLEVDEKEIQGKIVLSLLLTKST